MLYCPYLTQRGAPPTERVRLLYRTILRLHPVGRGLFFIKNGGNAMQTRVAVMAIIVEKGDAVERLNAVLPAGIRVLQAYDRPHGHTVPQKGHKHSVHSA